MTGILFLHPYMINLCNLILQKFEILSLTDSTLVLHYLKQLSLAIVQYYYTDLVYFIILVGLYHLLSLNIKNSSKNKYFIYSTINQIYNLFLLLYNYLFINTSYNKFITVKPYTSIEEYYLKNSTASIHISIRLLSESSFLLTKSMKL